MIKKIGFIIIFTVIFVFTFVVSGYTSALTIVYIDGKQVELTHKPFIENKQPLLSIEEALSLLGYDVSITDGRYIEATKGKKTLSLRLYSRIAFVNDKIIPLEDTILKKQGVPVINAKELVKLTGAKVTWNYDERTLNLYTKNELKVHFIDVGEGDAIFIDYGRYDILIDTGGTNSGKKVAQYLKDLNTDDIEIFIATQVDEKHIGGLGEIIKDFRIDNIVHSGVKDIRELNKDYYKLIKPGSTTKIMKDSNMNFDLGNGVEFRVIETGDDYNNENNNSVVTLLENNDVKFLFTGDMESDIEKMNLKLFEPVDILKVGNHGESTSTSEELINKIQPSVAIITNGILNSNASDEVEEYLKGQNIEVFQTKDSGHIIVSTDGNNYSIDNIFISNVEIERIDFYNKFIVLKNNNIKKFDMSGCQVTDLSGKKKYKIVENSTINAGETSLLDLIPITDDEGENENNSLYNIDGYSGILYDQYGHFLTKFIRD